MKRLRWGAVLLGLLLAMTWASPAQADAGGLPNTGSNVLPMLLGGLVLIAGGVCALIAARMRSRLTK